MSEEVKIKTADEINVMRRACRLVADILDQLGDFIKPDLCTEEIDRFVHAKTLAAGASPSPLGYRGFPKSCCVSINEVVCHGIPSPFVVLKKGDIVNVDVSCYKDGFHGDSSRMYYVGGEEACAPAAVQLVEATKGALYAAIDEVAPGKKLGDIGGAIEEYLAKNNLKYGIVREYTGHGIGRDFHEPPTVLHYGRRSAGLTLKEGMVFTIEPMINVGTYKTVLSKLDKWTVRTADGSLSAQWEHTIAVTKNGCEVLTKSSSF
ncbi:MAG TPA: type I methionyl aminopeptidase [Oligoflexia bacterium]|nr:type I methionyl aminopeptidase [Oligoflexia bacterium]HMP27957.1 type I methionyl aminopeptidase [Oligoflexia bacterium]